MGTKVTKRLTLEHLERMKMAIGVRIIVDEKRNVQKMHIAILPEPAKVAKPYTINNYTVIIGIDPDTKKSGVAIRYSGSKQMVCYLMTFFELFDKLEELIKTDTPLVRVEAGWLNAKSNFHGNGKQSKSVGERIAKNVGANHEAGRKIVEMCEYLGTTYELKQPQTAKMKPEVFERATGIKTRNQEKIDAGVLIL